jgi:Domain of Unknown Function (DUF1080)
MSTAVARYLLPGRLTVSDARDSVRNCTKAMTRCRHMDLCHASGARCRRARAILLCAGLLLGGTTGGKTAPPVREHRLNFETAAVGRLPVGFTTALTGRGRSGAWHIVEDPTTPSGGKVLAQTSADKTSYRFPLCVYDQLSATDVTVSVRFKTISGTVDQAAGLIVQRGRRKQFAGVDAKIPGGQWQRLTIEVTGTHFRVFINDTLLFEADDPTFQDAGKVGVWTKADSVTYFDDLTISSSDAH